MPRLIILFAHLVLLTSLVLLTGCGNATPAPATVTPDAGPPTITPSPPGPTPTLEVIDEPPTATPMVMTATAGETPAAPLAQVPLSARLLTNLVGRPVQSPEGHALGTLAGLVIERNPPRDPDAPEQAAVIQYGLLAAGEALGFENRPLLPVPWERFAIARFDNPPPAAGRSSAGAVTAPLSLNVEPAVLSEAPNFAANALPDVTTPGWDAPVASYWAANGDSVPVTGVASATTSATVTAEVTPTLPAQTPEPGVAPESGGTETPQSGGDTPIPNNASPLLVRGKPAGLSAAGPDGAPLGTVEDLILHPVSGQIAYAVLRSGSSHVVIPMAYFDWTAPPGDAAPGVLHLRVPGESLNDAPTFNSMEELAGAAGWEPAVEEYWRQIPLP